jgi:hypothetical protein
MPEPTRPDEGTATGTEDRGQAPVAPTPSPTGSNLGTAEPPADLREAITSALLQMVSDDQDDLAAPIYRDLVAKAVLRTVQAHVAAEVERARAEGAAQALRGMAAELEAAGEDVECTCLGYQDCGHSRAYQAYERAAELAQTRAGQHAVGKLWEMARRDATPAALLDQFHRRPGCDVEQPSEPSIDVPGVLDRLTYIEQEVAELREAVEAGDLPGALKELADVAYVVYGMAWRCRLPLDAAIVEVHRSNMTKTPSPGDGKAIKGPGYSPADMDAVLAAWATQGSTPQTPVSTQREAATRDLRRRFEAALTTGGLLPYLSAEDPDKLRERALADGAAQGLRDAADAYEAFANDTAAATAFAYQHYQAGGPHVPTLWLRHRADEIATGGEH